MIKKILISTIILVATLVIALTIFILTFDLNHYREFAQKKLSTALGYPVKIGAMHTKLSLIPAIQINNFRVLESEDSSKAILEIPKMEATVEVIPFLKGKIEIQEINIMLVSADLTLLSGKEKKAEQREGVSKKASNSNTLDQLWVSKIAINRTLCRFMNQGKKEAIEFDNLHIKDLNKLKFQMVYNKKKIDIEGSLGMLTKLISERKVLPIDLKIKHNNAVLAMKGQIGDLPTLSKIRLDVNSDILKLNNYLKIWNINVPKFLNVRLTSKFSLSGDLEKMILKNISITLDKKALEINASGQLTQLKENPSLALNLDVLLHSSKFAKSLSLKPFELKADLEADKTKAVLKNIDLRAGKSDLSGTLEIQWKDILSFEPNLKSAYLAIDDVLDKSDSSQKTVDQNKTTSSNVIPNKMFDFSVLQRFDLKGRVEVQNLFLTNQLTDYIGLILTPQLNKGILNLPFQGRILSGLTEGNIDINAAKKSFSLKMNAQNLNLDKIRSVDKTVQGAHVNAKVTLNSIGDTTQLFLFNLNGQLVIELLGGTITDRWFNSLPSTLSAAKQKSGWLDFSTSDQKTDISCGAINVPIKKGIITSDRKIVLQTNALNFSTSGQVNLKNETLDLSISPSVNQTRGMANQLLDTIQAVSLKGPWKDIKLDITAEKVVQNTVQKAAQIAAQKLSGQKPQILTNTSLCQKVLGKEFQQKRTTTTQPTQIKQKTSTKATPAKKETLKQQLIQSLNQVLTKETNKK